jgi:hypothetical protein
VLIALKFNPIGLAFRLILDAVVAVGSALNAYDQFAQGNYAGGLLSAVGAVAAFANVVGNCQYWQALSQQSAAVQAVGIYGAWGVKALAVANVGVGVYTGVTQIQDGDIVGGILSIGQAAASAYMLSQACFTGETKVLTRRGWVRMDELKALDEVLSCDENEPLREVGYKKVLEVFTFDLARIWHVQVKGKVIRTTSEHPFYVWGKGWRAARELEIGDRFRSHDGRMVAVEEVGDSGTWQKVYNCSVEDWHTYFVGGEEFGFGVWAHNACAVKVGGQANTYDLHLEFKAGWTGAQRNAALAKANALTNATGKAVVHDPPRNGSAQRDFRRANQLSARQDADHTVDLQLGGSDSLANILPLNNSVNRSMGAQIRGAIASLPNGAAIRNVTIGEPK